jgi:threonine/homoserine/homoserine lactone efflux protein
VIAFLLVATLVIVSPGPDFALTVHRTVAFGRRAGYATGLGVVTGQLVWQAATVAGLAALLVASRPAFVALRVVGAAYLVFLGLQAVLAAWRGRDHGARIRSGSGFRQGLLSNVGNPKMALFFTSLLPQFGGGTFALLGHSLVFSVLTAVWLALVVRAGGLLRVPWLRRTLDAITGLVLVAFGLRLATGRR